MMSILGDLVRVARLITTVHISCGDGKGTAGQTGSTGERQFVPGGREGEHSLRARRRGESASGSGGDRVSLSTPFEGLRDECEPPPFLLEVD
jgi:hypothetical protein